MTKLGNNINIICLESEALKMLIKKLAIQISNEVQPWLDEKEAMELLRIKSKTTLMKFKNQGAIEFRKLSSKHILYNRQSILDFIDNHKEHE